MLFQIPESVCCSKNADDEATADSARLVKDKRDSKAS